MMIYRSLLGLTVLIAFLSAASARPPRSPSSLDVRELEHLSKQQLIDLLLAHNGQMRMDASALVSTARDRHSASDSSSSTTYWWKYQNQDCGYDDISRDCQGKTVAECEKLCDADPNCGGFNTNGYLKKADCFQKKSDCSGCNVDLYVKESSPPPSSQPWVAAWPPVWPHPARYTNGTSTVVVSPQVQFIAVNSSMDLKDAFSRFLTRAFPHRLSNEKMMLLESLAGDAIQTITVNVENATAAIQLETDESYSLEISDTTGQVVIAAVTQVGVMHALESLSQLIRFDFDTQQYQIAGAPWAVDDAPRFKHRELLMDSSRHFQPVSSIKTLLESMTYAKINVLHWHIVDHQSFPFDSTRRPLLSRLGAYSPQERYTPQDVEDVIEFARARGIRVVVEVDNPGHAISWCAGYPEICPSTTCLQPLNPMQSLTFEVLADLFMDITGGERGAGPFFDNFLHLGGDEVDTTCWTQSPEISQWMKEHNMTTADAFYSFVDRAQDIARKMGRDVVGWEEIWNTFGTKLDPSTVVQVWLDANTAKGIVEAGYRTLYSPYQLWYLDYLGNDWLKMYNVEPCAGIDDVACAKYLLGGGGEMWGETVDISDIQQTVWPRLAAIAERLWSPRNINDTSMAEMRLASFRCLLNRRGVAAAPLLNSVARTAPPGPGGCYLQ